MSTRVVVVGAGMVGARFADELARADSAGRYDVTVLGAEEYEPYNRVLLCEVVAGRADVASLTLPAASGERVRLLRGREVLGLDLERRHVDVADGERISYDLLVLATGAQAFVPPIPGLDGARPAGVHVLRSVDDCRDVVAATVNAHRAVVLGGGLLGLEAACGLRQRGLAVTVVHHGDHLLDRQLGPAAAATLAGSAQALGLGVTVRANASAVTTDHAGRVTGLTLDDGRWFECDLLLLACGARPEKALAAAAGLTTDHGVVVTDRLRSPDDDRVAAIGDCAQPPGGSSGLVAQGWEQARRLALELCAEHPPATVAGSEPQREVVRLKAAGLDVVTMGTPDLPGARTLSLSDPQAGRYVEVSVLDGVLTGATCVGAGELAADLTVAFDRGTPVPLDPAALLVKGSGAAPAAPTSPTLMPSRATVCRCNGVTKGDVVHAWEGGACTVDEVALCTRAGTGCGSCRPVVAGLLEWLADVEPDRGPQPAQPSRAGGAAPVESVSETLVNR